MVLHDMSFTDQIAELEKAKAKLAQAEAKLAADRVAALSKLPGDYGYANLNDFIKALKDAAGKGRKGNKAGAKTSKAKTGKRARAKITPELKQQVIAAVQSGQSGAEIADAFSISLPSVQNIKKEAGLVKARGNSAVSSAAPESSETPAS